MGIVFARTFILYFIIIFAVRIMGKRQIGELQPSELVVAILLSDLAAVPMQSPDIPLLEGIIPIIVLITFEIMFAYFSLKSKYIRKFFTGEPSIIIQNGKLLQKEMKKQKLSLDDLMEELRQQGYADFSKVSYAILETNGKLSVFPKASEMPVTVSDMNINKPEEGITHLIIKDGSLDLKTLKLSQKKLDFVKNELKKLNLNSEAKIFVMSVNDLGLVDLILKEDEK